MKWSGGVTGQMLLEAAASCVLHSDDAADRIAATLVCRDGEALCQGIDMCPYLSWASVIFHRKTYDVKCPYVGTG